MLTLVIDPGKTSGIAMNLNGEIVTTCAFSDDEVVKLIESSSWDLVIFENFASGGRISSYGQDTLKLIGKIVATCERLGLKMCNHQPQFRYCGVPKARQFLQKTKHLKHQLEALSHLYAHDLLKHS